jgi:hypothetical protein
LRAGLQVAFGNFVHLGARGLSVSVDDGTVLGLLATTAGHGAISLLGPVRHFACFPFFGAWDKIALHHLSKLGAWVAAELSTKDHLSSALLVAPAAGFIA